MSNTMRYKLLGNSGLRVSETALGTMAFGEDWGWGADRDECRRILDAYREAGGNFVDTADKYTDGSAERHLGELLAPDRDKVVLATKYTLSRNPRDPNAAGNPPARGAAHHTGAELRQRTMTPTQTHGGTR